MEAALIKVLLVEDDEDFAFLMKKLLSRQPDIQIVGYCGDEDTVMEMVRREIPDVVLMDLNLGNSSADGIRLSRQIRIETDAKVLILTALNTPDIIMRSCQGGLCIRIYL